MLLAALLSNAMEAWGEGARDGEKKVKVSAREMLLVNGHWSVVNGQESLGADAPSLVNGQGESLVNGHLSLETDDQYPMTNDTGRSTAHDQSPMTNDTRSVNDQSPMTNDTERSEPHDADRRIRAVRLTVEDNGPGIQEEIRGRVFDPFFTTKDRMQHAGLGLWVTRTIAREHGGEVGLAREVGRGTRFHVDLPVGEG